MFSLSPRLPSACFPYHGGQVDGRRAGARRGRGRLECVAAVLDRRVLLADLRGGRTAACQVLASGGGCKVRRERIRTGSARNDRRGEQEVSGDHLRRITTDGRRKGGGNRLAVELECDRAVERAAARVRGIDRRRKRHGVAVLRQCIRRLR